MSDISSPRVLLVGINRYKSPEIPELAGCLNDVNGFQRLLKEKFRVPAENIKVLLNEQATREAILSAFREHLIARAGGKQSNFIFYFSGHGSQAPDPTRRKPGGMDETIVPHDSRIEGGYDIKDWELGQLIDELAKAGGQQIDVFLDCCHSGSGTRRQGGTQLEPGARYCPPDTRAQPQINPNPGRITRSDGSQNHVLLAACMNTEKAMEYPSLETSSEEIHWQGAMSFALQRELNQMSPHNPLTYEELRQRIARWIKEVYPRHPQHPQCEGDRRRLIFGGLSPEQEVLFRVTDNSNGRITVNAGQVHCLENGGLLRVYPPGTRVTRIRQTDSEKYVEVPGLADLRLEQTGPVSSQCLVETGEIQTIPLDAPVGIMRRTRLKPIYLAVPEQRLARELSQGLAEFEFAACLEQTEDKDRAELVLRQQDSGLQLLDNRGRILHQVMDTPRGYAFLRDVLHIVRYANALELTNPNPDSVLRGRLHLQAVTEAGKGRGVAIRNQSGLGLYFALFAFGEDWSVRQIYPELRGNAARLNPGEQFSCYPSVLQGASRSTLIKLFASVEVTEFDVLEQGSLAQGYAPRRSGQAEGLTGLLQDTMQGAGRRGSIIQRPRSEEHPAASDNEWGTARMDLTEDGR